MAISLISSNRFAGTIDVTSFSSSVSANAGDVIEVILQYKSSSSPLFAAPTWNGQTFVEIAARSSISGFYYHRFALKVSATATANITSSTSGGIFTVLNWGYNVWRSSTNGFMSTPFKTYTALSYTTGTFANPSITNTVASGEVVSAVLCTPNWDKDFATGSSTFAVSGDNTLIGSVTSTYTVNVKHLYTAYATGSGSVVSSFTKTGVQNPMYLYSTAILYEAVYLITSINGGNPITAGQTAIPIVATGFTAKPTAVTATYAFGAKSITATIDSGGSATNFNISIQDRIEAEDWPLNNSDITFTFTYNSESASGTQKLVKKATETVLTFSGAITSDPANLTYWLTQNGFTAEGGEIAYIPYGDLVLTADGGGSATNAGTFTSWFRPSTGTGAGNVYYYEWTVTEAGIQSVNRRTLKNTLKRILKNALKGIL